MLSFAWFVYFVGILLSISAIRLIRGQFLQPLWIVEDDVRRRV